MRALLSHCLESYSEQEIHPLDEAFAEEARL
jgi:hypothetical protein